MKHRYRAIIAIALSILALLAVLWRWDNRPYPRAAVESPPPLQDSDNHPRTDSIEDKKHLVEFPGFPPLRFTTKKTYTLAELGRTVGYPGIDTDLMLSLLARCSVEIDTDENGRIMRVSRNSGLYPSVSRQAEVADMFRQRDGYIIKRLGNDVASVNNKNFIRGLLHESLSSQFADYPDSTDMTDMPLPRNEVEVIPITFVISPTNTNTLPKNQELPGLLWKLKESAVPSDWRESWQNQSIALGDAQAVSWMITPIHTRPDGYEISRIIDDEGRVGTYLFELKIKEKDDGQSGD